MSCHGGDPVQTLRYVDGDLNPEEQAEFSRHLEVCPECRAQVEEEMDLSWLFRKTAPLYTAPAELRARLTHAQFESEKYSRDSRAESPQR
jgi:anti-sigma factor RsiW